MLFTLAVTTSYKLAVARDLFVVVIVKFYLRGQVQVVIADPIHTGRPNALVEVAHHVPVGIVPIVLVVRTAVDKAIGFTSNVQNLGELVTGIITITQPVHWAESGGCGIGMPISVQFGNVTVLIIQGRHIITARLTNGTGKPVQRVIAVAVIFGNLL